MDATFLPSSTAPPGGSAHVAHSCGMILPVLGALDGVAELSELAALGIPPRRVQRLAARGRLVRVRQGVYADPDADPRVVAAARVGGRLAGAAAAALHGLWVPPRPRLVVEVGRSADLRDPDDPGAPLDRSNQRVTVIWNRRRPPRRVGLSSVREVVPQVLRSEPVAGAVAILDSMLRRSELTEFDLELAASGLPATRRRILGLLDRRAESGTESIARCVLRDAGWRVEPQVRVPFTQLDRMDLLVEGRVVVECDSRHHDDSASRVRDAARDLALTALGFVVLRPRWETVMFDPSALVAAVSTLLRHLDTGHSVAV